MANEKEVKAQVKLRFKAANGQTLMVTRNLSVTAKKGGGMIFKTLEGVLSFASDDDPKGKVTPCLCFVARVDIVVEEHNFDKMREYGRGDPQLTGSFKICTGERDFLPSRRFTLAPFGTFAIEEKV